MVPIDFKIESLIHISFNDFRRNQKHDALSDQFKRLHLSGFKFKLFDSIKGEVDDLIRLAESTTPISPDREDFSSFIKEEKLAALRLLKFNSAAELARVENILDLPNQKTTATPVSAKPYTLKLYYCVFLKGKDFFILLDTNYHQFHWSLKRLIRSLRTEKESN